MFKFYLCAAFAVLLNTVAQVLLKVGANKTTDKSLILKYLNGYVLLGYAIFLNVTLLNLYAYKYIPIKMAVIFVPFTFILIGLFSFVLLKEEISIRQLISSLIIIVGVVVYNL